LDTDSSNESPTGRAGRQRIDGHPRDRTARLTIAIELALGFVALAALLMFAWAPVNLLMQVILSTCVIAVGYWISTRAVEARLALAFLSVGVTLRYLWWRWNYSLGVLDPLDQLVAWALFLAEIYGLAVMVLGYFQTAVLQPRRPCPLPDDTSRWPTVDVFVPSYDEPADIVRRTLIGALAMDYPGKRVHLLDDGRRPHMRALAEELGAVYHVRADNRHAKAGNINAALARTDGELVAIFDCDHVPVRSFLNVTVGGFVADPGLALVQTPHHFYNPDPFERNLGLHGQMPSENAMFYHAVQIGNDFWNSVLFCGSCAVIRRTALEQVGGIAVETVTEDAHTSLRMLARGWRSAYLDVPQAAGLATERYAFHVAQRIRWARGMTQILRLDNPLLMRGLTLPQRLAYLNAILHFQFGLPRLVFFLAPITYLLFGMHPIAANPWEMLAFVVPHMLLAIIAGSSGSRGMRHAFWAEVYEAALAPYTALVTLLALVAPRRGKFNVTVKGALTDRATFDWRSASPNLALLALCGSAALATPVRVWWKPDEAAALLFTGLFNVYNAMVLFAAIAVALERPQQRRSHRVRRAYAARLLAADDDTVLAEGATRDLTEEGMGLAFPPGTELPARARIALVRGDVATEPVPVRIVSAVRTPDAVVVGAALDGDVGLEARRTLVEAIFSSPDSWRVQGNHVTAIEALGGLLRAPWRALASVARGRQAA
jgi:cellulose synthase (UDP-forming)